MFWIQVLKVMTMMRAVYWVVMSRSLENLMPSGTNGLNLQDQTASQQETSTSKW
jgi:hypothetical protein